MNVNYTFFIKMNTNLATGITFLTNPFLFGSNVVPFNSIVEKTVFYDYLVFYSNNFPGIRGINVDIVSYKMEGVYIRLA